MRSERNMMERSRGDGVTGPAAKPAWRALGAALLAALVSGLAGCAGGEPAGQDDSAATSSTVDALRVKPQSIWVGVQIPVCWENPDIPTNNATERGWVQSQIQATWSASSDVVFTGTGPGGAWGTCSPGASGIHIRIADEQPRVVMLGRDLDGRPQGMVLNFTFSNFVGPGCAFRRQSCITSSATHVFGHALGFADDPQTCSDAPTEGVTMTVGSGESLSIMNCTSTWNSTLTDNDKTGLRQYYGSPAFVGNRKAAVMWPTNNKIYFFNGEQYTRFDISLVQADSGYPLDIAQFWSNWPSSWHVNGDPANPPGVDAAFDMGDGKAYFFHGQSYVRYDINADHVDQGPLPIGSNWQHWPTTPNWAKVDAAVRWTNGKVYLFSGNEYVRLDIASRTVDPGYPTSIAANWPGLSTFGFDHDIDYVIAYPNGSFFFFKGQQYLRFDFGANLVPGSPLPIAGEWPGVPF